MKLGSLFKAAVGVVTLPVAVVKDVFTLGGVSTKGKLETYTKDQIEQIADDLDDVTE